MKARVATLLALIAIPGVAAAQGISAIAPLYELTKGYIIKSAEQMPEANYAFKPTPQVRSFGQLIGHVANASYAMCSTAKGEKAPAVQDFEKTTEKAALVKALNDAFAYCDPIYKMADGAFSAPAELFGIKMTRLGFLMLNVTHDNEHYGNIVTYLRLKGMVPPSSQGNAM
jgi:uncharacterized damage-inducible protein DinB